MKTLVNYGDDSDDEDSNQQFLSVEQGSQQKSPLPEELRPPRRLSDVYDDDEIGTPIKDNGKSMDESEIIFQPGNDCSVLTQDEITPRSSAESIDDENLPKTYATTLATEMPPSPSIECDQKLEKKFEQFFEMKSRFDINDSIRLNKDFKNPALYQFLVEKYKIDEKGSNFDHSIYNPNDFAESDFYDALGNYQVARLQRLQEDTKKKQVKQQEHAKKVLKG